MRVLICGGRAPSSEVCDAVWNWVMENCTSGDVVIHGAARGVDEQAMIAAQTLPGVKHLPFAADWNAHGRAAGPIRNKRMLTEGKPDRVVAFPGGRGTANMCKQAKEAGVPVVEIRVAE
ncbi:SLOG family protein [Sulfitobacter faviae]|uniref:SLOG family protein n=1 Tax=Sulfitobacter faviae TaxID=1775881 RepID=UPI00398D4022